MEKEDFNTYSQQPEPEKKNSPKVSPLAAAYIGLVSVFILYQFGGSLLTVVIFGLDLNNVDITALRLLTTAGQVLFILLPALIFTKSFYTNVTEILRVKIPEISHLILFSIGLVLLSVVLQSYLYIQNFAIIKLADSFSWIEQAKNFLDKLDKMVEQSYSNLLVYNSTFEAVFIVLVVAVVPAICEETFFRGFVQRSFEFKYRPFASALITGIFFGIYHFNPYQAIPLIALGFYFGFASYKTNSIFVPMTLHFLNNFLAVLMYFSLGKEEISTPVSVSWDEVKISAITFVGFLVAFILILYLINRLINRKLQIDTEDLTDDAGKYS